MRAETVRRVAADLNLVRPERFAEPRLGLQALQELAGLGKAFPDAGKKRPAAAHATQDQAGKV